MPGAVDINENVIKPLEAIAYKDNGNWRAGSDAPGYEKGQFIPTRDVTKTSGNEVTRPAGDVGRAFTNRKRTNLVKANMRKNDLSESEARDKVNEELDKLQEAQREGDTSRIKDIRASLHGS